MKKIFALTILTIGIYSCSSFDNTNDRKNIIDTTGNSKIILHALDDYPVTDNMFYNKSYIKIDKLESNDEWFTNDTLGQTLVFSLYTDHHRMFTYHFLNNNLPNELKKHISFNFEGAETDKQKYIDSNFNKFIKNAKRISQKYFITTANSFQLGDDKQTVLKKIGNPTNNSLSRKTEIYEWKSTNTSNLKMYFQQEKLIAIFITRDAI